MSASPHKTRSCWIKLLTKIASPLLESLSQGKLKSSMPVEAMSGHLADREKVTRLEGYARLMAGMAPWLELDGGEHEEVQLRKKFLDLSNRSLEVIVNPESPDYSPFGCEGPGPAQPLVDAAFLCHALMRAPRKLEAALSDKTRQLLIDGLKLSSKIKSVENNWLLFSAMVEVMLFHMKQEFDIKKIEYAIQKHQEWYKGDSVYGDGPSFHFDYYNSYVIHPMLLDVTSQLISYDSKYSELHEVFLKRAKRYAVIQERLIAPDGTFPPIGRSLAYRCGAFQLLAQIALMKQLPSGLDPAQVREALNAVITRTLDAPNTFDEKGWLRIGLSGHQPSLGEGYISTGSLYLCSTAFLPLGLPPSDDFWTRPAKDWTSKRCWAGEDLKADKSI